MGIAALAKVRSGAVVFMLVFMTAFAPAQRASAAAPAIVVAPSVVDSGTIVAVDGTGFPANARVSAWLDTNANGSLDAHEPAIGPWPTDAGGAFSTVLLASEIPAGAYLVRAGNCPIQTAGAFDPCKATTGIASAPLTVRLSVSPFRFGSGQTTTVTGFGFPPGTNVNVWTDLNGNSVVDPGEDRISVAAPGGAFSTPYLVRSAPGALFIRAGPSGNPTASARVEIGSCWVQDEGCFIDGASTLCLIGNSPTDFFTFLSDCKSIDASYSGIVPATAGNVPPGGYDLSNVGPVFAGAGVLAAAVNDLNLAGIPGPGCVAMQLAITNAHANYGYPANGVPGEGFDLLKPTTSLTDIACGGSALTIAACATCVFDLGGLLPPPLYFPGGYLPAALAQCAIQLLPHECPGAAGSEIALIATVTAAIQAAAITAGPVIATAMVTAIAAGATGAALVPAMRAALVGLGLDPQIVASIEVALGPLLSAGVVMTDPTIVTGLILGAAQAAMAMLAVGGAVACGFVDYYCRGSDITGNILARPDLQNLLIPLPIFQPPIHSRPDPNPCRSLAGWPVAGMCWGDLIGWANVSCTTLVADKSCEQAAPSVPGGPAFPRLPTPGSSGINNLVAPVLCATGPVTGMSIGYDGDVSFDVWNPSVTPPAGSRSIPSLVNYHNFEPGPGGTDPPGGIDVEIPLKDRPMFLAQITRLRMGMQVKVCGHWVADMHQLWNELHPVTSLDILTAIPVTVTGSQPFGSSSPTFTYTPDVPLPGGVTLSGTISCTALTTPASIDASLAVGSATIDEASCGGLAPSDASHVVTYMGGAFDVIGTATTLTYTGPAAGDFNDPVALAATLVETAASVPVAGAAIDFTLNGIETCTATTNALGQASCPITPSEAAGPYSVGASFTAIGGNLGSAASSAFTVNREDTGLAFARPAFVATSQLLTLQATLYDPADVGESEVATPIAGKTVTFSLGAGGGLQTCAGTTDVTGLASCTIASVSQPLGTATLSATFAGDAFDRTASAAGSTIVFAYLSRGAFIVGNLSGVTNATVTWWSPKWSKVNLLSGGTAPSTFKGFAGVLSSTPPIAGGTWSTSGGNSGVPPTSVPAYIAVIITTFVKQINSTTFSGADTHIAIVRVSPGYNPATGSPGTGTLIGILQ